MTLRVTAVPLTTGNGEPTFGPENVERVHATPAEVYLYSGQSTTWWLYPEGITYALLVEDVVTTEEEETS